MSGFGNGPLLIAALRLLPKNALSRLAGRFVSIPWPGPLQRLQIRAFAGVFGVELDEVKDPTDSFACLQDCFVRELADGARPPPPGAEASGRQPRGPRPAPGPVEVRVLGAEDVAQVIVRAGPALGRHVHVVLCRPAVVAAAGLSSTVAADNPSLEFATLSRRRARGGPCRPG